MPLIYFALAPRRGKMQRQEKRFSHRRVFLLYLFKDTAVRANLTHNLGPTALLKC